MFLIIAGLAAIFLGIYLFASPMLIYALPFPPMVKKILPAKAIAVLTIAGGVMLLLMTSFVFVDGKRVGHLKRIYAFSDLPPGHIIALNGQKGPQARILGPGFHFIPFIRVLYHVEQRIVISIPAGYYGEITALDGKPMPSGMFMAPAFKDDREALMLNAENFIKQGGYRGPQETVLKPGEYRLNQYLFKVTVSQATKATVIPAGHVGVVKSNILTPGTTCIKEKVSAAKAAGISGALSVPLVPKGCVGIWKTPLFPGAYYMNHKAYEVTLIDTRVQTWEYLGGFTKRIIDLSVDQQGNIKQTERSERHEVPSNAADSAVYVKIEGWDIPLELRVLVQIIPENAAVVVGSVGGMEEVENRILTPVIRSIVRNVAGSQIRVPVKNADGTIDESGATHVRPTRVLDLISNRNSLENTIEQKIKIEGRKAGVEIKEIRLAEPTIPPELLVSRLREQLADQLAKAYKRESLTQQQRIETEKARATANKQPELVAAQIAVSVAKQRELERAALGSAERKFLEELARGQKAQANVLGQDRVAMLQGLEKLLATLEKKPELVQLISRLVPHTVVSGNGGGLAGAAAILGNVMKSTPDK